MLTFAAAAAQRQQRRQRAAQAVAAAADRRGGSCGSGGFCRGRVHGGGTCGVWQRRRQWWVCRMPRRVLGHAAAAVIAPTAPACGGGVCGCVGMACVGGGLGRGVEITVSGHTPGTHQAHTRHMTGRHTSCTCHAHAMHMPCTHRSCTQNVNGAWIFLKRHCKIGPTMFEWPTVVLKRNSAVKH